MLWKTCYTKKCPGLMLFLTIFKASLHQPPFALRKRERERKKECHALQLPPIKSNLVHALTSISRWAEAKSLSRSLFLTSLIIKGGRGKGGGGMEGSYHVTTTI
jgi:hypothetical protein